eukprot:TRINITY_DN4781_c0_g1_i1.p1 TRINITY_DN4781_c0_g1~~TRINITY_DN4781_c0_g1_i1.p1  ORF type:complete len:273 (+),score=52.32 TRINITY_DN4781_c0_g1_i1:620-1438(+)
MTERTGGSDVSNTETIAKHIEGKNYELHGYKFFTSATLSEIAFALARIVDSDGKSKPGSRGLSVFYIKLRDDEGNLQNIKIHRLKDKWGTKPLPTAELELCGTPAYLVGEIGRGVPTISALFNITRIWATLSGSSTMKSGISIARDYAHRRIAFGKPLTEHPLHVHTLSLLEVMYRGHLHLGCYESLLQGKIETGKASKEDESLLRILTPLGKIYTSKESLKVLSECIEALGGLGYMEDASPLPQMFATQHVNTIWEGTTNVLSLDLLRALV